MGEGVDYSLSVTFLTNCLHSLPSCAFPSSILLLPDVSSSLPTNCAVVKNTLFCEFSRPQWFPSVPRHEFVGGKSWEFFSKKTNIEVRGCECCKHLCVVALYNAVVLTVRASCDGRAGRCGPSYVSPVCVLSAGGTLWPGRVARRQRNTIRLFLGSTR